ncbi:MAG TPA: sugar phosphate nucleotidyltransferase [Kineosporiaceae bacterium]
MSATLAGVVLAAGAGTRLAPLTALRPKALCPVGGIPLLDLALRRLAARCGDGAAHLAVNTHHHADQITAHLAGRAHVNVEQPEALGTAGALGALRDWIDGRDVFVTNADAFLPAGVTVRGGLTFSEGWDGERCRLACVVVPASGDGASTPAPGLADFRLPDGRGVRYVGAALLPWRRVRDLPPTPSGLYEVLWRAQAEQAALDLQVIDGPAIDCGTVADYLRANLVASGGRSVVGAGAVVHGRLTRSVVWDGARVSVDEHLVDVVRACGGGVTLTVGSGAAGG